MFPKRIQYLYSTTNPPASLYKATHSDNVETLSRPLIISYLQQRVRELVDGLRRQPETESVVHGSGRSYDVGDFGDKFQRQVTIDEDDPVAGSKRLGE